MKRNKGKQKKESMIKLIKIKCLKLLLKTSIKMLDHIMKKRLMIIKKVFTIKNQIEMNQIFKKRAFPIDIMFLWQMLWLRVMKIKIKMVMKMLMMMKVKMEVKGGQQVNK